MLILQSKAKRYVFAAIFRNVEGAFVKEWTNQMPVRNTVTLNSASFAGITTIIIEVDSKIFALIS